MSTYLTRLCRNESGATKIEYGLIAALVAAGLTFSLTALAGSSNPQDQEAQKVQLRRVSE